MDSNTEMKDIFTSTVQNKNIAINHLVSKYHMNNHALHLNQITNHIRKNQNIDVNNLIKPLKDYSLFNSYRYRLAKLWHPYDRHRYLFSARISKFYIHSCHRNLPGMLLLRIYYQHKEMTDHCWIFHDDLRKILNSPFQIGQRISFFAKVHRYSKFWNGNRFYDFVVKDLNHIKFVRGDL